MSEFQTRPGDIPAEILEPSPGFAERVQARLDAEIAALAMCVCGHSAKWHWHSSIERGTEYSWCDCGDCSCESFRFRDGEGA